VFPPPFSSLDQRDAFYKPIPKNHERDRNIPANCKTKIDLIAAALARAPTPTTPQIETPPARSTLTGALETIDDAHNKYARRSHRASII
jgi:hypothetical protein